ncbi:Pimeloyl-ACP methyl ester carboxylesterase [Lachnospiraceae bacterium XBB1006]|nr:Pimeloyl-ACP methyl ester carboxylesterase [Lachnospiraceae bacterium XBB1006]
MKKIIKHTIALTSLTVAGLHLTNCIIEEKATQKRILTTRNGHYFSWKYGDIFYTKQGKGSPVLLIHNLTPDSSSFEWNKLILQLSKKHTVYAIDLLGCGRSDKPQIIYTNYIYVQLVKDFISKVIKRKTDVIASGQSTTFSLMANVLNTDIINKLVFINPKSIYENNNIGNKNSNIFNIIMNMPVLGTYLYNILMRKDYIENQCNKDYCGKEYYITQDMIDAYYESAHLKHSKGRYLFASIYNNYTNVNIKKAITNLKNPLLLIQSEERETSENIFDEYLKLNEEIQTKIITNTNCLPHIEASRRTCDYIESFLK